jgi:hypothetical protein
MLLSALAIGMTFLPRPASAPSAPMVTNFTECAAVGNPIMESFPRRCRDQQGNTFTEEIPPRTESVPEKPILQEPSAMIEVSAPLPLTRIQSPFTATGKARGYWYFEASFPVTLRDGNGAVLSTGIAQAQGDWMTEEFVPFAITLNWATTTTSGGTLEFHRDNPSGLPENDAMVTVPVIF